MGPGKDRLAFSSALLRHLHQVPLWLTKCGKSKSHRRASARGCAQAKSPPPLQGPRTQASLPVPVLAAQATASADPSLPHGSVAPA